MYSKYLDQTPFSIGLFQYLKNLQLKKSPTKSKQIFVQKKHFFLTTETILEDRSCSVTFQHHAQNSDFWHLISAEISSCCLTKKILKCVFWKVFVSIMYFI